MNKKEDKNTEILKPLNMDIFLLILESNWTVMLNLKKSLQDVLRCHVHKKGAEHWISWKQKRLQELLLPAWRLK